MRSLALLLLLLQSTYPAPGPGRQRVYHAPLVNTDYGGVPSSSTSVTSINTSTSPGANPGPISGVQSGDIFFNVCGVNQSQNTSVTSTSSPSASWSSLPVSLISGLNGQITSIGTGAASSSSSAYATCTTANAQTGGWAEIFLDISCPTCVLVFGQSTNTGAPFETQISLTGITATAGAHDLFVVMCASSGTSNTWSSGTLTGSGFTTVLFDTVAVSEGPGYGSGKLACEVAYTNQSMSNVTATYNVSTLNALTASVAVFQF